LMAFQKRNNVPKKDITPEELIDEIMYTYAKRLDFIDPERGIKYRYEDLLTQPNETIAKIVKFLGLDAPDQIISNMALAINKRDQQAVRHMTAESPLKSIGRWKRNLDRQYVHRFEKYSQLIEKLGYDV